MPGLDNQGNPAYFANAAGHPGVFGRVSIDYCGLQLFDQAKQVTPGREFKFGRKINKINRYPFLLTAPGELGIFAHDHADAKTKFFHLTQLGKCAYLLSTPGTRPVSVDDKRCLVHEYTVGTGIKI